MTHATQSERQTRQFDFPSALLGAAIAIAVASIGSWYFAASAPPPPVSKTDIVHFLNQLPEPGYGSRYHWMSVHNDGTMTLFMGGKYDGINISSNNIDDIAAEVRTRGIALSKVGLD